jgi:hypothetical protein
MAVFKDILQATLEGDLKIVNGDFVIGPSDSQHIKDIIYENVGCYKQYPTCGVGLDEDQFMPIKMQELKQRINIQLSKDGYKIINLGLSYNPSTEDLVITPNAVR